MAERIASEVGSEAGAREAALEEWLRARGSALLGFSGGVDSAYLAVVANGVLPRGRFLAVIGRSASYPAEQWAEARELADRFEIPVLEVATDELHDPNYAANPSNRCYFCKSELWNRLVPIARARGLHAVLDGTNADDLHGHRPGARAAREFGVESPLAELGFTKAEIRALSRERGIAGWNKPASPCLSSRLPTGIAVTPERLARIERAERSLRALGIRGDLRVRHHGDLARVELSGDELDAWHAADRWASLESAVQAAGYLRVELDPRGYRSGSLHAVSHLRED